MAIPKSDSDSASALNTVAVVPYDVAPTTSAASRSRAALAASARSASSLVSAASNLISAIAQGSSTYRKDAAHPTTESSEDVDSDDGSASFTYHAPAEASSSSQPAGWYASTPYHISNRYYDADITLKATRAALSSSESTSSAHVPESVLAQTFPAYLVVVDRSRSLEHHRRLASSLESSIGSGFDAEISIVAGVSLLSSAHPQLVSNIDDEPTSAAACHTGIQGAGERTKISDLVAVYADVGWEFIAIDEAGDDGSEVSASEDDADEAEEEDRDSHDGIERIREALMNHMWHGLVRKDQPIRSSRLASAAAGEQGHGQELVEEHGEYQDELADAGLPSLGVDAHAEASDLDEQLAKLFLASSSRADDVAELEAFLASQDPSWPTGSATATAAVSATPAAGGGGRFDAEACEFDDDFGDFLPFQSAPSAGSDGRSLEGEDLPSAQEIARMQNVLFGTSGSLRTASAPGERAGDDDLVGQLEQLRFHAERVRNMADPDQRRRQAALIALAFSTQWSDDSQAPPSDISSLAF